MKNLKNYDEDYENTPQFTVKEVHDCASVVANAIYICIKQNGSIRDIQDYLDHWMMMNGIPVETWKHVSTIVASTLTALGYER